MATRLIGTDSENPRLPDVVIAATQGITADDLAAGDTLAEANSYTNATFTTAEADATTKADAAQEFAIQRANHTGTQEIATVTGLQTALDTKLDQTAGDARYVELDGDVMTDGLQIQHDFDSQIWFFNSDGTAAYGSVGGDTTATFLTAPAGKPAVLQIDGVTAFSVNATTAQSTVPLLLPANPTLALEAATKAYADTKAPLNRTIDSSHSGTNYTLVLADNAKILTNNSPSAHTATVPSNALVAFPIGCTIDFVQLGTGQITVSAGAGATVNKAMPTAKTRAQYSRLTLTKLATDSWVLSGDAAAS